MRATICWLWVAASTAACGTDRAPASRSESAVSDGRGALFEDVAREVGLDFVYSNGMTGALLTPEVMGAGVALFDYDGDGDLDVYLVQGQLLGSHGAVDAVGSAAHPRTTSGRLYRNDMPPGRPSELRFTDVSDETGISSLAVGYGMGVAVGDFDGDGRPDLYLTNLGSNLLLRNGADGRWHDVSESSGTADPRWSVAAVFFDADRDGDLDLWVGNYLDFDLDPPPICYDLIGARDYCGPGKYPAAADAFYRNRGDGTFEDATAEVGLAVLPEPALGVAVADFDGNGWLDLYVANDARPNFLWLSDGNGGFRDQALLAGAALSGSGEAQASMGVAAGDYDNDGRIDLFVTHLDREWSTLYRGLGGGLFEDVTHEAGLVAPTLPYTGFGAGFLDYDNDGWLDLIQVNGAIHRIPAQAERGDPLPLAQPNQLLHNRGDGTFEEIRAAAGSAFAMALVSRGAAFGDIDNDGDIDVLIANTNAPVQLLFNRLNDRVDRATVRAHWLGIHLLEGEPPRDAPGAEARLERVGGPTLVRTVRIEGSYASSSDPRIVFGLGDSPEYERVRVRWPDGTEEVWTGLPVGAYTTLRRGTGDSR
jgi:enediyne biosynthesis protein E4